MRDLLSRIGRIAVALCLLGGMTFAVACGGGAEEGAVGEAGAGVEEAAQMTDDLGGDPPPPF